jgi:hypothetical protein
MIAPQVSTLAFSPPPSMKTRVTVSPFRPVPNVSLLAIWLAPGMPAVLGRKLYDFSADRNRRKPFAI